MASSSVAVVTLVVHRKSEEPVPMITTRALPPLSGTCCPSRRCAARLEKASMHIAASPTINDDFRSIILSPVVSRYHPNRKRLLVLSCGRSAWLRWQGVHEDNPEATASPPGKLHFPEEAKRQIYDNG